MTMVSKVGVISLSQRVKLGMSDILLVLARGHRESQGGMG